MDRRIALFVSIVLTSAGGAACSKQAASEKQDPADAASSAVRRNFGSGPVTLHIDLSASSLTTADALTCTMTLRVEQGHAAEFPDLAFPEGVPGMILTRYDQREAEQGTQQVVVREYELEPEYTGVFEIPALQVFYHREDEVQEQMFATDALEFEVKETPASADMLALRPFRGLVTVAQIEAERRRTWPWVVALVAGVGGLAAVVVYLIRRPSAVPPPPPAHEVALEALRALAAKDLIAQGQIEPFFVEVTRIVRDYIEWSFGLRAPEQTTEEFLANITTAPVVARYRNVLEPFLTAADEVKFAQATPEPKAIQRTFDTARDFVLQTSSAEGDGR